MKISALLILALITPLIVAEDLDALWEKGMDEVSLFQHFQEEYGRKIDPSRRDFEQEKAKRFKNFQESLRTIRRLNEEAKGETTFGITETSDLSDEEFSKLYLNGVRGHEEMIKELPHISEVVNITNRRGFPDSLEWKDKGAVSRAKDQGQCGCCWTFSTVGGLEGQYFQKTGKLVEFSTQQLIDCDHSCRGGTCNDGCDGGNVDICITQYLNPLGGINKLTDYPFAGIVHKTCNYDSSNAIKMKTKSYYVGTNEEEIKKYLNEVGPLPMYFRVIDSFRYYRRGVYDDSACKGYINHAVLLTGYGTYNGKAFWNIKNSWGSSWGENGYFRMAKGKNMCNMSGTAVWITSL